MMLVSSLALGAALLAAASGQAIDFSSAKICYTKSFSFGVCVEPGQCQVRGDGSSRCSADQICCKRDQVQLKPPTTTTTPPPPVQLVSDCGLAHPNTFLLRSRRRRSLTSPARYGEETDRQAVFGGETTTPRSDIVETTGEAGEVTTPGAETDGASVADGGSYHSDIVGLLVTGGTDKPSVVTTPSTSSDASSAANGETTTLPTDTEGPLLMDTTGKPSIMEHTNAHAGVEHTHAYAGVEHTNGHSGVEDTDKTSVIDVETTSPLTDTVEPSVVEGVDKPSATEGTDKTSVTDGEATTDRTETDTLPAANGTDEPSYVEGADKTSHVSGTDKALAVEGSDKPSIETTTDTPSEVNGTDFSTTQETDRHSVGTTTDSLPTTDSTDTPPETTATTPSAAETTYTPPTEPSATPTSSPSTPTVEATSASPDAERPSVAVSEPATVGRWPWIALLGEARPHNGSTHWFCGGTLVAPNTVLTAAHCVAGRDAARMTVRLGEYDLSKSGDGRHVDVDVTAVIVHPEYRASHDDIALLRLSQPVSFSTRVRPACLPAAGADLTGAEADLAGWRQLEFADAVPQRLQQVQLHVMDEGECEETYRGSETFESSFPGGFRGTKLCAAGRDGTSRDACQGDSGGPLVVREESGRYQVVGVVATGLGCAIPKYPAVYTKVSEYIQWIVDNSQ